jgi:NAD(P)-dependent dehydrogenase (short-subunit alcohol dehydrogenase family)
MSKAAANMAGVSLAHDLREQGIAVVLLHPGTVRTSLIGNLPPDQKGLIEPEVAARGLLERIDELALENASSFRHANGDILPW